MRYDFQRWCHKLKSNDPMIQWCKVLHVFWLSWPEEPDNLHNVTKAFVLVIRVENVLLTWVRSFFGWWELKVWNSWRQWMASQTWGIVRQDFLLSLALTFPDFGWDVFAVNLSNCRFIILSHLLVWFSVGINLSDFPFNSLSPVYGLAGIFPRLLVRLSV